MPDLNLSRLHWGGKLAATAFLCAVGVGFIFSTLQITTHHGGMGYGDIVADYYGEPAMRDSLDAYWAGVKADLLERFGEEPTQREPEQTTMTFTLDNLGDFEEQRAASQHDALLRLSLIHI